MAEETMTPAIPEIVCKPENKKWYVRIGTKEYGPWDELDDRFLFSPGNARWAVRGKLHGKHYLLSDGGRYGPFDHYIKSPRFDPARGAFAFNAERGGEFMLVAGGKVVKKGKVIEKPGEGEFVVVNGRRYGPYMMIAESLFSPSGRRWAAGALSEDGKSFLLLNGKIFGPFKTAGQIEFSAGEERCFCRCDRGRGGGLLVDGEAFFGPYKDHSGPWLSPDGRRWGLDIGKEKRWHGFVVDGVEYGPFPFQFFVPRFSPDGRHWAVVLDSGHEDRPHSFILDGARYGPFKISEIGFMEDGRFICTFLRRNFFVISLDGREIGAYRKHGERIRGIGGAVIADLVFVKEGKKTVRRCVISCKPEGSEKYIFFSPHSGETLAEAIGIINAADTPEGVAAEYAYLRLKFGSLGKQFDVVRQELIQRRKKHYDMLTVELEGGKHEDYYFDITEFFGKFTGALAKHSVDGVRRTGRIKIKSDENG